MVDPFAESVEIYALAGSRYELKGAFAGEDILQSPLLPGWGIPAGNLFSL
jgi:Uma2 family endonuclease